MRGRLRKFSVITSLFSGGFCLIASVPSTWGADNAAEPSASSALKTSLPAPFSETLFTFQQIEQQKLDLKERIVRVEISKVLGEGDAGGNNLLRFIAKDTSKSATPYGQVAFPRDGLKKTGLQQEGKGPLVVYFRVHVVSTKAAAICEAVGTRFSSNSQGAHYEW
jgi:hypothetical protein